MTAGIEAGRPSSLIDEAFWGRAQDNDGQPQQQCATRGIM
jgi:hypothetical protein